jgi:MscS family membrane protein
MVSPAVSVYDSAMILPLDAEFTGADTRFAAVLSGRGVRGCSEAARTLVLVLCAAAAPAAQDAGPAPAGGASPAPAAPVVAADSPRAAVAAFLELTREGRYAEAARYLEVPGPQQLEAAQLARRLKAVLDRHLWVDLHSLSPTPEGDLDDELPPGTDRLGVVPSRSGGPEPVELVRRPGPDQPGWAFSAATVSRIDAWYDALADRWIRDVLPEVLLRPGPRELLWWQWLSLPILFGLAWLVGRALGWTTARVVKRLTRRTRTPWDDSILAGLRGPVTLAWTLVVAYLLVPWLSLYAPAQDFIERLLGASALLTLFFALFRSVGVTGGILRASPWGTGNPAALALFGIGVRVGQVLVLAMGLIAALAHLGYPVASLLAGLGIGGLAVALAAQKTFENLFGSLSLAIDQPIRVGDFVKVDDFVGTVEHIGLRSTQIRTLDRTLVSIPNGVLADKRLESFTARDRMRLACTVGLVYETSASQMRTVLDGLERVLRAHPKIWPDAVVVRFKEFASSSLDIEVMAWFQTPDWSEFQLIRQEVLLQFMEVVEGAGSSFAFPTRTVHLAGSTGGEPLHRQA